MQETACPTGSVHSKLCIQPQFPVTLQRNTHKTMLGCPHNQTLTESFKDLPLHSAARFSRAPTRQRACGAHVILDPDATLTGKSPSTVKDPEPTGRFSGISFGGSGLYAYPASVNGPETLQQTVNFTDPHSHCTFLTTPVPYDDAMHFARSGDHTQGLACATRIVCWEYRLADWPPSGSLID